MPQPSARSGRVEEEIDPLRRRRPRVRLQRRDQRRRPSGLDERVVVHRRDPLPPGRGDPEVGPRRETEVAPRPEDAVREAGGRSRPATPPDRRRRSSAPSRRRASRQGTRSGLRPEGGDDGGQRRHRHSISTRSRITPFSAPGGAGPCAARTSGSAAPRQSTGPTSTVSQTRSRPGVQEASSRSPCQDVEGEGDRLVADELGGKAEPHPAAPRRHRRLQPLADPQHPAAAVAGPLHHPAVGVEMAAALADLRVLEFHDARRHPGRRRGEERRGPEHQRDPGQAAAPAGYRALSPAATRAARSAGSTAAGQTQVAVRGRIELGKKRAMSTPSRPLRASSGVGAAVGEVVGPPRHRHPDERQRQRQRREAAEERPRLPRAPGRRRAAAPGRCRAGASRSGRSGRGATSRRTTRCAAPRSPGRGGSAPPDGAAAGCAAPGAAGAPAAGAARPARSRTARTPRRRRGRRTP